jgi:hypothetical protein
LQSLRVLACMWSESSYLYSNLYGYTVKDEQ